MHRFYCHSHDISGDVIAISDKNQLHHLKDVLSLRREEQVIIFDEKGNEYSCIIETLLPKSAILKIKDIFKSSNPQEFKIAIACAIPKDSRMDEIIDKLTQLGVDRIIPLETERIIVKLDKDKIILRQERWKKIALNSSEQSQRNTLPVIEPIKNLKKLLSEINDYDLKLIPTLIGERETLKDILSKAKPKKILVLIGPEGDFSPKEVDLAKKAGFIPVSLGKLTLRVETAAVAVASFIKFYLFSTCQPASPAGRLGKVVESA